MSISMIRSTIDRLNREVSALRSKVADETRKAADATAKMNRASGYARRATSTSSLNSATRDIERAQKDLGSATNRRAQHERAIANKSAELLRNQRSLASEEDRQRRKNEAEAKRLEQARDRRVRDLEGLLSSRRRSIVRNLPKPVPHNQEGEFDCFLSHASEDKQDFVRGLARELEKYEVTFFYDEISIGWGESLRQRIDSALARSTFGVVVLSKAFFTKEWAKRELDALVQLEVAGKVKILPIWHQVTKDEVIAFSPMMVDKVALKTADFTVAEIAEQIAKICGKNRRLA